VELHQRWKKELDKILYLAKQKNKEHWKAKISQTPLGSKARRLYQLLHKNASSTLPATMKHPDYPSKLVTGQLVNELWGKSASATRPNSMPKVSTETERPPWLDPSLWNQICSRITPMQHELMAPISGVELRTFFQTTRRSCPGFDRIQYDVLKFMCFDDALQDLDLCQVVLRFLNLLIRQRKMPKSMKQALLTFIYKSGDPLAYETYR
jgi:hypothetical protein